MKKIDLRTEPVAEDKRTQLKQLLPEVFTESLDERGNPVEGIDWEKLKAALGEFSEVFENRRERYGMNWPGKRDAMRILQQRTTATLKPCRDESVDFDATQNLFLEGDNLEVLRLLQKSYFGKVKMIYIDPPYNTGKDFVYKDNYHDNLANYLELTGQTDEEGRKLTTNAATEGRYHTNWLNMMYPRLYLARNLLREDGVIFISIDDNEVDNLKKLCNEVFGEGNFLAQIVLITGANQSGEGIQIQTNTEYCLVYALSASQMVINHVDKVDDSLRNLNDAPTPLETRPDMGYSIYYNPTTGDFFPVNDYDKTKIHLNLEEQVYSTRQDLIDKGYIAIRPGSRNNKLHRWRWGFEGFIERKAEVIIEKKGNDYGVFFRQSGFNTPKNLMKFRSGTSELKDLFGGEKLFDFPKGSDYLQRLLSLGSNDDSIVVDFFAGTCTFAHAVFSLNLEDDGQRQYVMVQYPESLDDTEERKKKNKTAIKFCDRLGVPRTIAEIGKERIRRVIQKIRAEQAEKEPTLPGLEEEKSPQDLGFRVFKLARSNFRVWQDLSVDATEEEILDYLHQHVFHLDENATEEDILFEILLKAGYTLTEPMETLQLAGKRVYSIADGALMLCLENEITQELVDEVVARQPMQFICLDSAFHGNDQLKANAAQTFKALNEDRADAEPIIFRTV